MQFSVHLALLAIHIINHDADILIVLYRVTRKKLVKVNSYNSKNTKRRTVNKKSHERIQLQVLFGIHVTAVLYIFHSLTSFF